LYWAVRRSLHAFGSGCAYTIGEIANAMKKAALLYNPRAGPQGRDRRRVALVERVAATLRSDGIDAIPVETRGPGAASVQAMEMIAAGCDTIIACGGDGTVHETMQQMIERRADAALAVLPLGTGNALATDLGLPRGPERGAHALLDCVPRRIAVGRMESLQSGAARARYFVVTAGVGGDAHMLYHLDFELKRRYGMIAYYVQSTIILLRHKFPPFTVEFCQEGRL